MTLITENYIVLLYTYRSLFHLKINILINLTTLYYSSIVYLNIQFIFDQRMKGNNVTEYSDKFGI